MTARKYTKWRKSTRSDQGNCVEVARADNGGVGVRDSKDTGPVLEFTATSWAAFSNAVGARTDDRRLTPRE
ncbi:DUF397 domain-containing protein [Micromonospora sp. NPDC050980]|uniref:DUF397 domain-containing protein n=1 Tax=Micromonospora sp. NPDC050980 TaxID=3155161 RepID=UPI0033E55953